MNSAHLIFSQREPVRAQGAATFLSVVLSAPEALIQGKAAATMFPRDERSAAQGAVSAPASPESVRPWGAQGRRQECRRSLGAALALLVAASLSHAESTSYTPAAGYFTLTLQGQSDNHVSIPLVQKAVAFGRVSAVAADKVTVRAGSWARAEFRFLAGVQDGSFYAEFASGPLKGARYRILDNSEDTLLLDTEGDDLTAHPLGAVGFDDVVRICPLWTVSKVFGATETEVVLDPKPNPLSPGDAVLLRDNSTTGQNKAPIAEYSFVQGMGWRATGDTANDRAQQPFAIGEPLIVRRLAAQSLSVALLGHIATGKQTLYVAGGDGAQGNDAYVTLLFPEPVSLATAGLYDPSDPSGSVIQGSRNALIRGDELLSYRDSTGFNLAPERIFFYLVNVGWREFGSPSTAAGGEFFLQPGKAYIIRKKKNHPGVDWVQSP